MLQILHVEREPQDEVLVGDVHEELGRCRADDVAHRRLDLGVEAGPGVVGRSFGARSHHAREDERRQVLEVARAELDAEVLLREPAEQRRDLLLRQAPPAAVPSRARSCDTRSAAIAMCITTSAMPNSLTK
nr:hypothetical protein GCM10025699_19100 [Microbacterium flavescens]